MNNYRNNRIILFISSIIILLIDQITKKIVLNNLYYSESFVIIPNILKITLEKNTGAAFSLFSNSTSVLTFISLLVSIILIIIICRYPPRSRFNSLALPFLLGGTLGNGIDRLLNGFVIDIFAFIPVQFPIFNIADISINIAVIFMIIELIKTSIDSNRI